MVRQGLRVHLSLLAALVVSGMRPQNLQKVQDSISSTPGIPCGLDVFQTLDAEATLGDAKVRFLDRCQDAYPANLCSPAAAELWQGQNLTAKFAHTEQSDFCQTLKLVVAVTTRSALLDDSEAHREMEQVVSRKFMCGLFGRCPEDAVSGDDTVESSSSRHRRRRDRRRRDRRRRNRRRDRRRRDRRRRDRRRSRERSVGRSLSWDAETGSVRKSTVRNELEQRNAWLDATIREGKYDKMGATAFTFYRGTAHLYYRDLDAQDLIAASAFSSPNDYTWIQGDSHVENFGAFDDDTGTVVFDLNDFDESWPTHYQYDVWRTAISLVLIARINGFSNADSFVDSFSEFYLDTLEEYRGNDGEKDAKVTKQNAYGRLDNFLEDVEEKESRTKMLDKWTKNGGSGRKFDKENPKLAAVDSETGAGWVYAINEYKDKLSSSLAGDSQYFVVKDVAERLGAGLGSFGTPRFYVLIEGASSSQNDDRILDVKLQSTPSMYPFLTSSEQGRLSHLFQANEMGCRVAYAQRALLTDVDDHLGCATFAGKSFSVRERSPFKETFDFTDLDSVNRLTNLAEQYGAILATAHARADSDFDDSVVPHSLESVMNDLADTKHAEFREEVRRIAEEYADQVAVDYDLFQELRAEGSID